MAEIIEGESRESHAEPRGLDRAFAEMAEIGVERLATGHGEEDGAKRCKPNPSMIGQEHHAMGRIEGGEHAGVLGDMRKPADGKGDEPDERDRSEEGGDPRRAVRLHREQSEQNQKGKRDDVSLQGRAWRSESPSTADSTEIAGVIRASP